MNLSKRIFTTILLSGLYLFASTEAETPPAETQNDETTVTTKDSTPSPTDAAVASIPDTVHPYAPGKRESKLNTNNDKGFWAIVDVKKNLSPEWLALFHTEQRWGSNYTLYWYQEYDLTFLYNLTEKIRAAYCLCPNDLFRNFFIGGGASQISLIKKDTREKFKWVWVTRPELEMQLILGYKGWLLEQRLRAQYIYFHTDHYKNFADCRYRLILSAPTLSSCFCITPYVSNEFFVRANTWHKSKPHGNVGGLFENRLRFGFDLPLIANKLDAKVWWQWRTLKQNRTESRRYNNTYQFGGTLAMSF